MKKTENSKIGSLFGTTFAGALIALTGCVLEPGHGRVYVPPAPGYVEAGIVVRDDYVYYPGYEVYYSGSRRQYIYLEGRSWVTRPQPPRVSVDVLFASPSVRLDFHDAPSAHHSRVIRDYPKHWTPPNPGPRHEKDFRDEGNRNDRGGRGK